MTYLVNRIASRLTRRGQHPVFHAVVIALILTAALVLRTASAWGVMGAIVIAISCYVMIAAVLAEMVLLGSAVLRNLARRALGSGVVTGPLDR